MKVLGIYHSADLDGKCSGAIVLKKYPEAVLHGMNYGDETPWALIEQAELVIISDFSLPLADMIKIDEDRDLLWYDHHISQIKETEDYVFCGLRDIKRAGCELTWMGLFPNEIMPRVVKMLGAYDCWRWVHEDKSKQEAILNLQYGMRLKQWEPDDKDWPSLFRFGVESNIFNHAIIAGRACREYQAQMMERINRSGIVISWEGHQWFTVNTHNASSIDFEKKVAELDDIDGVIAYRRGKKGDWTYSLRSFTDVDVSVIAKKHGGGGHKAAAGFSSFELLEVLT